MKLDNIKPCEPAAFATDLAMYCLLADEYGARFIAATAEAQAEATKAARRVGIEHAKASGERYKGRKPSFTREQFETVRDMLGLDEGVSIIAKATGRSRQTIYRIKDAAVGSEAALLSLGR